MIAGLSAMTVVVEAGARSGSLATARIAAELGRPVGAVPGPVTSPRATGTNALLAAGATVVRGAQDVLDALFGAGTRVATSDPRTAPTSRQELLLREVGAGCDTVAQLVRAAAAGRAGTAEVLIDLAALETAGWIRRGGGGRYTVVP
jgi:DNA processing protein